MTLPRLVIVDPPAPRAPRMIEEGTRTDGQRLILVPPPPDPEVRDLRAWGDPYPGPDGDMVVKAVTELAWYRMQETGAAPGAGEWMEYSADVLWLE